MRTIGRKNVQELKSIIEEESKIGSKVDLESRIKQRIPDSWYDTWEMAYQEIDRIIDDHLVKMSLR